MDIHLHFRINTDGRYADLRDVDRIKCPSRQPSHSADDCTYDDFLVSTNDKEPTSIADHALDAK